MNWFTYLPLPTFSSLPFPALPVRLQKKLLSFLLRKSIGSFVKGQLAEDGIDLSQGNVTVSNLELLAETINPLLDPSISFVSGTIGTVSAQVTWPLSFASTLSITVEDLDIVLRLVPPLPGEAYDEMEASIMSVAVASEFVREALSQEEDDELRESLHINSILIPGGFSPRRPPEMVEEKGDTGEAEVTILAGVIERIMARLDVKFRKIHIRLMYGESGEELEMRIDRLSYADETPTSETTTPPSSIIRSIRLSAPTIHLKTPLPTTPRSRASSSSSTARASSSSRSSSSSSSSESIGRQQDLLMSQSIADLRTSVYASATFTGGMSSIVETSDEGSPFVNPETQEESIEVEGDECRQICRLGGGNAVGTDDIVISLTSSRTALHTIAISVSGSIIIALLPFQLASLLRMTQLVLDNNHLTPAKPSPPTLTAPAMTTNLNIHSINILQAYHPHASEAIPTSFWLNSNKTPSPFQSSHLRLRLETLSITVAPCESMLALYSLMLTETVHSQTTSRVLPILISDPNLATHMDQSREVETIDWVSDTSGEATGWRVRLPKGKKVGKAVDQPKMAISARVTAKSKCVSLGGIQIFIDLTIIPRLILFLSSLNFPTLPTTTAPTSSTSHTPRPATIGRHILDDLNFEPMKVEKQLPELSITCDTIRVKLRCPPPLRDQLDEMAGQMRSGILLVDIIKGSAELNEGVMRLEWQRAAASLVSLQATHVSPFISITSLKSSGNVGDHDIRHDDVALSPSIVVEQSQSTSDLSTSRDSHFSTTSIDCRLPLVHTAIDKVALDGLQLLADDLSLWSARTFGDDSRANARNERMLGSRYFGAKSFSRRRVESESDDSVMDGAQALILKIALTDVIADISVPRSYPSSVQLPRQLRASASDLTITVQMLRNSSNDLICDLAVTDLKLEDASTVAAPIIIFSRNLPPNLNLEMVPLLELRVNTSVEKDTSIKESKIRLSLNNFVYHLTTDISWVEDLGTFTKAPPGVFETVVPNELTRVRVHLNDGSIRFSPPTIRSSVVLSIARVDLSTNIIPDVPRSQMTLKLQGVRALMIDDLSQLSDGAIRADSGIQHWKSQGYVQLLNIESGAVQILQGNGLVLPDLEGFVSDAKLDLTLCADSVSAIGAMVSDISDSARSKSIPTATLRTPAPTSTATAKIDKELEDFENDDDVPIDYLTDALDPISRSRHTQASRMSSSTASRRGKIISNIDGETIRMLDPRGIRILDDFLSDPRVDTNDAVARTSPSLSRYRLKDCDISVRLHSGYDWSKTRHALVSESKAVRRRLEKIRQLLADGQQSDASAEETSVLMFGSVQLGLSPGATDLREEELLAAIDEQLLRPEVDDQSEAMTWQDEGQGTTGESTASTYVEGTNRSNVARKEAGSKRLTRSATFEIEINLRKIGASFETYLPADVIASRLRLDVDSFDIIDNIRTSTWKKFLTELRFSDGGTMRASKESMLRFDMKLMREIGPRVTQSGTEEVIAKLKVSPLRLYIDQDALEFIKTFGSFQAQPVASQKVDSSSSDAPFFQRFEVLPVKIKLDYKPKRVDYTALRKGKTAELMNFFHFDGSEMTLRHLVVTGIAGVNRLSDLVQDIWSPDVKANQLADVLSGIAPVRSVINVGSGVANLVLLPIEQYRKDGRLVRGIQKGATAFARSTTLEALDVGARLATGTQVILERAETVLGARSNPTTQSPRGPRSASSSSHLDSDTARDLISRYADQPSDAQSGIEGAYKSLGENFKSAAQTILAIPMEVYERSGSEGPVRAIVRAVPIAVLRPMIGASEAVSKTLLGIRNSLDPRAQDEVADKYKRSM